MGSPEQPEVGEEVEVGPLDDDTLRPARSLSLAQAAAMALLVVATLVVATVLAPRTLAGLGLLGRTDATVTRVVSGPGAGSGVDGAEADPTAPDAGDSVTGRSGCQPQRLSVTWADDKSGTVTRCVAGGAANDAGGADARAGADAASTGSLSPGDTVAVWALAGWDPVVAGARSSETILAVLMLLIVLAAGWGVIVYTRQWRAVVAVGRGPVSSVRLPATVDRLLIQRGAFKKGGRARIRVTFEDAAVQPLRMVLPQHVERSLLGARVEVSPLGRTLRGRRRGPYVVRRQAAEGARSGTMVALGRAYRDGHER